MDVLTRYCQCLDAKDLDGLMELFTEDMLFDDRGGQDLGRPPFIREGKAAYKAAMEGVFASPGPWKVTLVGRAYGNVVFYDVDRGEGVLPCVGVCRRAQDGRIREYKVFVREPD